MIDLSQYPKIQRDIESRITAISPLIVIDPVDKERNAAAALSINKFSSFKRLAKNYLKNQDNK